MTTNIQPLHDRVIVKRIDEGEQVRGGIIIPDSAKEKPQEGEVIAAGLGKYKEDGSRQALDVKAGDRFSFSPETADFQRDLAAHANGALVWRIAFGSGGPVLTYDAVEFCRGLSGRGEAALGTEVPF